MDGSVPLKFNHARALMWFSAAQGLALAAVLFAFVGVAAAMMGALVGSTVCFFCLGLASKYNDDDSPYLKLSEQIAMVGMMAMLPVMLVAGVLPGLLVMLVFAQLALNLQTHDFRRFYTGIVVSFVLICAGAAQTRSGAYLIFFLLYGISLCIALAHAYAAKQAGHDVGRAQAGGVLQATVMLTVVTILVYLLLPRFPAGNLGGRPASSEFYHNSAWEAQARDSSGEALDIARQEQSTAEHQQDGEAPTPQRPAESTPAQSDGFSYHGFENSFSLDPQTPQQAGKGPANGIIAYMRADSPLYLRARIFDRFDGVSWSSSATTLTRFNMEREGLALNVPDRPEFESRRESYEIYVEHNLGDYIPVSAQPARLRFPGTVVAMDAFGQLRSPAPLRSGTAYAAESVLHVRDQRVFAELSYDNLPGYLHLPADMDRRIGALANGIAGDASSGLDAAIRLEQHLRNHYDYDLGSVFTSQGRTPLSSFLFDTKKGHCEYFASALAIMLRTQGIPSRLVTGFSATNQNPLTGFYEIHALDGHAWVEAWVDNQGWVVLEPTAYYDGPMPERQTLSAQQIDRYVERQKRLSDAIGDAEISAGDVLVALWQGAALLFTILLAWLKLAVLQTWPVLLVLAVIALIGLMLWKHYRRYWYEHRLAARVTAYRDSDIREAQTFYLQSIDELLTLRGFSRPAGLSIESFCDWLSDQLAAQVPASLTRDFNTVQYIQGAGLTGQDAAHFRQLFFRLYRVR